MAAETLCCTLGSLANGGRATITVTLRPQIRDTIAARASVASATADPIAANSSASTRTVLRRRAPAGRGLANEEGPPAPRTDGPWSFQRDDQLPTRPPSSLTTITVAERGRARAPPAP